MSTYADRGPKSLRGTTHVAEKLEKTIEAGDYYHALQMYKTLYARYTAQNKQNELRQTLLRGASLLLAAGEVNAGTELALLFVDNLSKAKEYPKQEYISALLEVFRHYKADNDPAKRQFIQAACKWSATPENNKQGDVALHTAFAANYHAAKEYELAQKHYLRGSDTAGFAKMVQEWAIDSIEVREDHLICRVVLLYLCFSDLKSANSFFLHAKAALQQSTPLLSFAEFLLQTVERDALPLFQLLREKFDIYLSQDPSFDSYLDHIAYVFYGVKKVDSNSGFGGMINNLLKSFME
eukprot:TRINITY_DN5543_c0_g2_i1.p1 TRINITY_DN5543_c0_g2~~TRINITY_DN5543_c0_g2_i1.p1  ORF type:complete len:295 (+),score=53.95 TRINITY_DN5543_c0_g2_i1:41-925(+)